MKSIFETSFHLPDNNEGSNIEKCLNIDLIRSPSFNLVLCIVDANESTGAFA
jgi:hypothetical protein